ncbi:MAG: hypothetical protein EGR97_02510 [Clostridiales bacterium]|nr:hypothetical protein [Clostridiales bacterium]
MKNKALNILLCVCGILIALVSAFVLKGQVPKQLSGVLISIGAGLFGMTASNLFLIRYNSRHPEESRRADIESRDERTIAIRNRAKAMSADIIQWCIIALAAVSIVMDAQLWVTLVIVGVFLLKNVLEVILMIKYEKEM